MRILWQQFWTDPAVASRVWRYLGRVGIALAGYAVSVGIIPTGVDGGQQWGLLIATLGQSLIPSSPLTLQPQPMPPLGPAESR